jgi:hypothetical protein
MTEEDRQTDFLEQAIMKYRRKTDRPSRKSDNGSQKKTDRQIVHSRTSHNRSKSKTKLDRLYLQEPWQSEDRQTNVLELQEQGIMAVRRQTEILYIQEQVTMTVRRQKDRLYIKEQVIIEDRRQTDILYLQEPVIIAVGRQTDKCTGASRTRNNGSQKTDRNTVHSRTNHNDSQKRQTYYTLKNKS